MPTECSHDPATAQRQCICDPACICRVAGSCPQMSGDAIPPMKIEPEDLLKGPTFTWPADRAVLEPLLGEPLVEQLDDGSLPQEAFTVGRAEKPIEVVPKERLRAELVAWQDEWPGIEQLEEK